MKLNRLYYGDNLDVLRRHIDDESVDLVYLDPPFNSDQDYNVLFAERDGTQAASQIRAFEDTWRWDESAARSCADVIEAGGRVSQVMQAFRTFLGDTDMMAYLAMMAPRLVELRRVLKPTGSIYLHCDPTASHYLKLLMDAVFGPQRFRSEIIWKRTSAHSASKRWNDVHDTLLFYTKSEAYIWNPILLAHSEEYAERFKRVEPDGRRWTDDNLTGPGTRSGESGAPWRGFDPTAKGLHWKVSNRAVENLVGAEQCRQLGTLEKLDLLDSRGLIYWPKKGTSRSFPRFKRYLSEGSPIQDIIADIPPLNSQAQERLGYPTQKPEALLERIIVASTAEDNVVLDPFCGCGTTIAAAQRLNRRWIGIDITSLAIGLIRHRLADSFGTQAVYEVIGEPVSLPDAAKLATDDPYQFQWWALGLVGARPTEGKKGADKGVDGRIYFHDDVSKGTKQVVLSVKAGHVTVAHVRDLRGVVERENAAIGVLLCMEDATTAMRKEAASAGFYKSPWGSHPRLQILTIEDLLTGRTINRPPAQTSSTFKRAPKADTARERPGRFQFSER